MGSGAERSDSIGNLFVFGGEYAFRFSALIHATATFSMVSNISFHKPQALSFDAYWIYVRWLSGIM